MRDLTELFQSTLPVRGATGVLIFGQHEDRFQSTLPVRGATGEVMGPNFTDGFQSTLPVRGATRWPRCLAA